MKWAKLLTKVLIPIVYFFFSVSIGTSLSFPMTVVLILSFIGSVWVYNVVKAVIYYDEYNQRILNKENAELEQLMKELGEYSKKLDKK